MTFYQKHQYRPEEKNTQSIGQMVNAFGLQDAAIEQIFGAGGDLARALPTYAPRDAQQQAAQMASRAFKQRKQTIIEGQTGLGKSVAFAVPAFLHALDSRLPVVLSTSNNTLISQYATKDLPDIVRALAPRTIKSHGRELRFAVAKGRSNSLCKSQLKLLLTSGRYDKYRDALDLISRFDQTTQTGDMADFPGFDLKSHPLASRLAATRENCVGRTNCHWGEECHFYNSRDSWGQADIIVTNHAMLAISLLMPDAILPPFDGFIIDEAHQLEKYMTDYLTTKVDPGRWSKLMEVVQDRLSESTLSICNEFYEWFRANVKPGKRPRTPDAILDQAANMAAMLAAKSDLNKGVIDSLTEQCDAIRHVCGAHTTDRVSWIDETQHENHNQIFIKSAPTNPGKFLKERLWNKPGVVTSATLCVGDGHDSFDFLKNQLGLETKLTLQLKSPFDWHKNCLYYYPKPGTFMESDSVKRISESQDQWAKRWADKITPTIKRLLELTAGRAFVICTTAAVYKIVYQNLLDLKLDFPMKMQGELSKGDMLTWFKSEQSPVLIGTASYREGVDVAGAQLSCVILDRIEFPNGNDPLEAARMKALGDVSFQQYQIPYAVTVLRQTLGRLLRLLTDRGVFALLDPKVHSKAYVRKQILSALPGGAVEALDRRGPVNISEFLRVSYDVVVPADFVAGPDPWERPGAIQVVGPAPWHEPVVVDISGAKPAQDYRQARTSDMPEHGPSKDLDLSPLLGSTPSEAKELAGLWAEAEQGPVSDRFLGVLDKSRLRTATRLSRNFVSLILDQRGNDNVA